MRKSPTTWHGYFWCRFHRLVTRCYCPAKEVSERALKAGLKPSQIRVYGLPIRPSFCRAIPPKVKKRMFTLLYYRIDRNAFFVIVLNSFSYITSPEVKKIKDAHFAPSCNSFCFFFAPSYLSSSSKFFF